VVEETGGKRLIWGPFLLTVLPLLLTIPPVFRFLALPYAPRSSQILFRTLPRNPLKMGRNPLFVEFLSGFLKEVLRKEGVEPTRPFGHRILSPARLPVPPLPRGESITPLHNAIISTTGAGGRTRLIDG
jgi:hypothetical protein